MDLSATQIHQDIERIIRAYLTAHPHTAAATLLRPGQGAKKIAAQVKPLRDYLDANNISDKRATNSLRSIRVSLINEMNTDTNDENMPDANRRYVKARRPPQAYTPNKRAKAEKPHFTPDHFKDPNTRTNRTSTYNFQQRRLFEEDMVIKEVEEVEEVEVEPDAQTMLDAYTIDDIELSKLRTGDETVAAANVSEDMKRMVDKNSDVFNQRMKKAGDDNDIMFFDELRNDEVSGINSLRHEILKDRSSAAKIEQQLAGKKAELYAIQQKAEQERDAEIAVANQKIAAANQKYKDLISSVSVKQQILGQKSTAFELRVNGNSAPAFLHVAKACHDSIEKASLYYQAKSRNGPSAANEERNAAHAAFSSTNELRQAYGRNEFTKVVSLCQNTETPEVQLPFN